jgi:predicted nucleotidyltransferase
MDESPWTEEELAVYRRTAELLREQDRPAEIVRRAAAWRLAREAAALLKERFHASRVVVFGSLANEDRSFTRWSDVDIAAWGIAPADTLRAIGAIMDMSTEPMVNLVDVNTSKPALLVAIERDGVEL